MAVPCWGPRPGSFLLLPLCRVIAGLSTSTTFGPSQGRESKVMNRDSSSEGSRSFRFTPLRSTLLSARGTYALLRQIHRATLRQGLKIRLVLAIHLVQLVYDQVEK
jgi:hypothetical protein